MNPPHSFPIPLRVTEREIDGIVHQLFRLPPAEIALIGEAIL